MKFCCRLSTLMGTLDLTAFLKEQPTLIDECDEQLIGRLFEKIMLYEDKLTVEYKSGVEVEVEIKKLECLEVSCGLMKLTRYFWHILVNYVEGMNQKVYNNKYNGGKKLQDLI